MTSRELGYLRDIRDAADRAINHTREQYPTIDWPGRIGLRNILVHRYQEIDYGQLWTIVNRDLAAVVEQLSEHLGRNP